MRLRVRHRTIYRYSAPIAYAIQSLRLQPSPYEGLTVLHWQVSGDDGRRSPNCDHCRRSEYRNAGSCYRGNATVEGLRGSRCCYRGDCDPRG